MLIFYIILILGLGGIGYVLWNMKNETESQNLSVEKVDPGQIGSLKINETFSAASSEFSIPTTPSPNIKLKFKKSFSIGNLAQSFPELLKKIKLPSLKKNKPVDSMFNKPIASKEKFGVNPFDTPNAKKSELFGAPSMPTQPVFSQTPSRQLNPDEVKKIEAEIDLSSKYQDIKEKYDRLEKILNEKNSEFDKIQENLIHEQKNRKEFNKIKDLLEKELKDTKDQMKESQSQLNLSQIETEGHKKRITQLEEKATKLEKEILKKEEEIDTLVKKLQTFASPATAATPPKKEPIKEESLPIPVEQQPIVESKIEPIINSDSQENLKNDQIPESPTTISFQEKTLKLQSQPDPQPEPTTIDLDPKTQQSPESQDLNLQPPSPSTDQIKNLVDILSTPQESVDATADTPSTPEESPEEKPFLKLNPDITSIDETPKDKPQT